jgi:hypothetical protein
MGFQFRLDLAPPPPDRGERPDSEEPVLWLEPGTESGHHAAGEAAPDTAEPINADVPPVAATAEAVDGGDGQTRLYPTSLPGVYLSHPPGAAD